MPTVALVHDYVIGLGGSERVLLTMHRAFPEAPLHTAFFRPDDTFPGLRSADVRPFALNRVGWMRNHHRLALPLLPFAFGRAHIEADVLVCGTSGWSAGVRTTGRKIAYVHAPARWLNDQDAYLEGRARVERLGLRAAEPALRRWDRAAMLSADRHLVPSRAMGDLLAELYGVRAEVLAPPVTLAVDGPADPPAADLGEGFVLYPARLVANKNVDVVMEAFRLRPDDHLVVAGDGPERERLVAQAPDNVSLVGAADDDAMRWLYRSCRMVVSAAHESFGLAVVEGAAFGRPCVALRHGGALDTIVDGDTGVLYDAIAAEPISEAIDRLDALAPPPARLTAHAERWSEARFIERLRAIVDEEASA